MPDLAFKMAEVNLCNPFYHGSRPVHVAFLQKKYCVHMYLVSERFLAARGGGPRPSFSYSARQAHYQQRTPQSQKFIEIHPWRGNFKVRKEILRYAVSQTGNQFLLPIIVP